MSPDESVGGRDGPHVGDHRSQISVAHPRPIGRRLEDQQATILRDAEADGPHPIGRRQLSPRVRPPPWSDWAHTAAQFAQVLDRGVTEPDSKNHQEIRQALEDIETESRRCGGIVRSVLQFSRDERTEQWDGRLGDLLARSIRLYEARVSTETPPEIDLLVPNIEGGIDGAAAILELRSITPPAILLWEKTEENPRRRPAKAHSVEPLLRGP